MLKLQIQQRRNRTKNHISINFHIIIRYGIVILFDYGLIKFIDILLIEDIQKYTIISGLYDRSKIFLVTLFLFAVIIHGILSTLGQIKLDYQLTKEDEV